MRYYISEQRIKKLAVKESSLIARGGKGGRGGGRGGQSVSGLAWTLASTEAAALIITSLYRP